MNTHRHHQSTMYEHTVSGIELRRLMRSSVMSLTTDDDALVLRSIDSNTRPDSGVLLPSKFRFVLMEIFTIIILRMNRLHCVTFTLFLWVVLRIYTSRISTISNLYFLF